MFKKERRENRKGERKGGGKEGKKLCSRNISCKVKKIPLTKVSHSQRILANQGFIEPLYLHNLTVWIENLGNTANIYLFYLI